MSVTLTITILVEGVLASLFSLKFAKPIGPILITSLIGNLLTQSLLWLGLWVFYRQYLTALFVAEVLIWLLEGSLFYIVRANQLRLAEALWLSLGLNLSSFALGWWLPV